MTTKLPSLSVFYPCFNEADTIPQLLADCAITLPSIADSYQVIVINDGSTDHTELVLKQLLTKYSFLKVVTHKRNTGYGAAVISGIKASTKQWIFYTDGDRQFRLSQLQDCLPFTKLYPAIIGYRHSRADALIRRINARIFKTIIDFLFHLHVKDVDCAFKLIRADILKPLSLQSQGALISTELLYLLKYQQFPIKQIPVDHIKRRYGTPTGNHPRVILRALKEMIVLSFRLHHLSQRN